MASISTVNSMGEIFSDKTPLIAKNKRYVSKSVYNYMTTVSENGNKENKMYIVHDNSVTDCWARLMIKESNQEFGQGQ